MEIPIQCNREITYMLYNYENIEKLIDERNNDSKKKKNNDIMQAMSFDDTEVLGFGSPKYK